MIHQNEIRIGNEVLYSASNTTFIVKGIDEYGLTVQGWNEETYMEFDQFEGVPLTSDILLKAGFEEFQGVLYYKADEPLSLEYKSYLGRVSWLSLNVMGEEHCLEHIKHLHQLQNLWHILTNTELKIDL